jgi:hypothetical protein
MIAQMISGGMTADALVVPRMPTIDRELLRLWLVRLLTVVVILIGVALTFYILGTLGFAVYGLPRSSFRRSARATATAATTTTTASATAA